MSALNDVMKIMETLAGEKEKTASGTVGSGNYISVNAKYGMNGYAYCGTTIRYAFEQSGHKDIIKGCSNPAYVPTIRKWMDSQGWKVNNSEAKKGDIFVYGNDDHVGFVYEKVSGTTVITIEGNATVYATAQQARNANVGAGSYEGIGYKKRNMNNSFKVYRPSYDGSVATPKVDLSSKAIGTAVSLTDMNIRTGPSTNDNKIDAIDENVTVKVLEVLDNGWYKICWDTANGYAYVSNTTGTYFKYTPEVKKEEAPVKPAVKAADMAVAQKKDDNLRGSYKVTAFSGLNLRAGAGTNYKVLALLPCGSRVGNYGYYNEVNGVKWLYVTTTYKNVTYTGFVSSEYLRKV